METPSPPVVRRPGATGSEELAEQFDPLLRRLNALRWREGRRLGLSSTALSVLGQLRCGPRRITDLAAVERIAQPSMTKLVNRLEERGWVTRAADPDDGRSVLAMLSAQGQQALIEQTRERVESLGERLGMLSGAQRAALAAALPALENLVDGWEAQ